MFHGISIGGDDYLVIVRNADDFNEFYVEINEVKPKEH